MKVAFSGQRVCLLVSYSGLPAGTIGRVVSYNQLGKRWGVLVQWDAPPAIPPLIKAGTQVLGTAAVLQDRFTKSKYEKFFIEE